MIKFDLLPKYVQNENGKCRACMLTKITRKPFPKIEMKINKLDLVYSDICDLHGIISLGGNK